MIRYIIAGIRDVAEKQISPAKHVSRREKKEKIKDFRVPPLGMSSSLCI